MTFFGLCFILYFLKLSVMEVDYCCSYYIAMCNNHHSGVQLPSKIIWSSLIDEDRVITGCMSVNPNQMVPIEGNSFQGIVIS